MEDPLADHPLRTLFPGDPDFEDLELIFQHVCEEKGIHNAVLGLIGSTSESGYLEVRNGTVFRDEEES